jgi:curli biogenesis system outer membrane secretion channel CsgG
MCDELRVIEFTTGEVVSTINVEGKSERAIDRCEMGLLRNMNLEAFGVERWTKETKCPTIKLWRCCARLLQPI